MATVTIVLRKSKPNRNREYPIYFRIIKNRKPVYIASEIRLPKELWDEKKLRVKSGHKNSGRLNAYLNNKLTELYDSILENEIQTKSISVKSLKENAFGKGNQLYYPFAEKILESYKLDGKIGTYHKNLAVLNKLKEYHKKENLTFQDISYSFLIDYELYLRSKLKNRINTVNKDMKFHRKVFNDAIRQDIIDYNVSPFRKYQMKLEKTQREYLTEEELSWIDRYPATPGSRIELHKKMFIFASYVGGLRVSDILKLQWRDFDGTHLHVIIKKTGVQVSIKVPNKGLEIIQSLKPEDEAKDSFIFPVLPEALDIKSAEALDTAISRGTALINNTLKVIAKAVGIQKNLSFHISRHSFAVRALRKGISIDKVSKLMGHSNIRETQIYARVVNEDLDKAMDVFNN